MNTTMFGIASTLLLAAAGHAAVDWNLSGKVTDAASGSGLSGVEVRLAVAGTKVVTASDGSWSIGTSSVLGRRLPSPTNI
ncbi:MAG TPA: hypothetical protein PKY05_18905, partial [Fibrobacteria bacterium]|nr:hypothetical protein [Fibrobacteria bacterium]